MRNADGARAASARPPPPGEVEAAVQNRLEHTPASGYLHAVSTITVELDTTLEAEAGRNGYPPGWLELYGLLAGDSAFEAPHRAPPRLVEALHTS